MVYSSALIWFRGSIMLFSRLKQHIVLLIFLLAATLLIYYQAIGHNFLNDWDDHRYITENNAIRGISWEHLKTAFTSVYVGNYAPLHIISYMVDYSLWGMNPAGFIFTNIFLHFLNGALLYVILLNITKRRLWAFLAAFLFICHPVQVESVAWISQRKNVLAMYFFLNSFLFFLLYREKGWKNGKTYYICSVALFVFSLLSKSIAIILPPILLVYEYSFHAQSKRDRQIIDKVPFFIAAIIIAFIALKTQVPDYEGGRTAFHGGSQLATLYTMLPVFIRYITLVIWPVNLSAIYDPPIRTEPDAAVVFSVMLLVVISFCGYYVLRSRKDLSFWGYVILIGLLPVSQFVPLITLINDRYLYFPMLGVTVLIAGGIDRLYELNGPLRKLVIPVMMPILLALSLLSAMRVKVWQSSKTLWVDAVSKSPDSALVLTSLGSAYRREGDYESAITYYNKALKIKPLDRNSLNNIAYVLLLKQEHEKAYPYILTLINSYPNFSNSHFLLGKYFLSKGNIHDGERAFSKGLELDPSSIPAMISLGDIYLSQRKYELAQQFYKKAVLTDGGKSPELLQKLNFLEAIKE